MNFSRSWFYGTSAKILIATTPFVNEVTTEAPDIICVEVLDPIIQRGLCQFSGSSFPGTDQTWTTANNPLTGTLNDSCTPLGNPGMLYTRRFTDNMPSVFYNRNAGDVVGNWSINNGLTITGVYRKSYPYSEGQPSYGTTGSGHAATTSRHYVWLKLSGNLSSGTTYTITLPAGTGLGPITFAFNEKTTRARSLRVNQAGHRASDDMKLGYLASLVYGYGTEGQVEFTSTYGISSFNIIDKNGTVAYSSGTFSQRVAPTTVETNDNGGVLRWYESAQQTPANILGITAANPGVFTTDIPMSNGQIVRLQGLGLGLQLTGMSWSGGIVTFTGPNSQSGDTYAVGQYFTISGALPSGYNGTFQAITGTNTTTLKAAMVSDPGSASVNGIMSNPHGSQMNMPAPNTSNYYYVANATSSPNTCTLKAFNLTTGAAGTDISTVSAGLWGPGTFMNPAVCNALVADTNRGYGFDSLMVPCYQANRAATYVYGLDYSAATATDLPSSGSPYRLQIPGVGVSDPINITDATWYNNAWASAKGIYHQTSGPAIDGRFGYSRPAALTNGLNGTVLYTSLLPMAFTSESGGYTANSTLKEGLIAFAPFITATVGPAGLGGGYHDSGDWPLLTYAHCPVFSQLLDLGYEYAGGTTSSIAAAATTTFNFPRMSQTWGSTYAGTDSLPDVIHMAVYLAEYLRQTQDAFGAVASGNSFGSFNYGDGGPSEFIPSNASSYAFALSAPDHVANYCFAQLAAKLAIIFYNNGFSTLATMWQTAAIDAFAWSEGIWTGLQTDPNFYYNTAAYNGTALGIIANTVTGNGLYGANCPVWTTGTLATALGTVGLISGLGTITGGSGGTPGTYNGVALTASANGISATANITVGAGGNVTSVAIVSKGQNFVYNETISANPSDIGGCTGFSSSVHFCTPSPSNSMGYHAWVTRFNASGTLFRMQGVLGGSQTTYGNAFLQAGLGVGVVGCFTGAWEATNAINNTAELAMLTASNYPTNFTIAAGNTCTGAENATNAYYTTGGSINVDPQMYNLAYGYIVTVRASGTSAALAVRIRKALAAQEALVLGANQTGLCITEGLGARNTLGVLHRDWQAVAQAIGGLQPPPIGITPWGWAGTVFPTGTLSFSTDNVQNWTVTNPTGINEATYGTKRIVSPNNQCLPMWDGLVETSACVPIMEFAGPGQIIAQLLANIWLWCWDGNTSKT